MRKFIKKRKPILKRRRGTAWYNKKYSVGDLAHKAYRGVKYIKGLINVEKKFFDVAGTAQAISSTPLILNLSNIATGDDYNQRDGNSILLQSLQWRIAMYANSAAVAHRIRIIVFRDNDQRGTDPAASDLLEVTGSNNIINSPLLHYVNQRFSVLSDKVYTLCINGDNYFRTVKKFMKMPQGTHIKYQSTAGADASNWEGALYALFVSVDVTNTPSMDYYFRLRFTDN